MPKCRSVDLQHLLPGNFGFRPFLRRFAGTGVRNGTFLAILWRHVRQGQLPLHMAAGGGGGLSRAQALAATLGFLVIGVQLKRTGIGLCGFSAFSGRGGQNIAKQAPRRGVARRKTQHRPYRRFRFRIVAVCSLPRRHFHEALRGVRYVYKFCHKP